MSVSVFVSPSRILLVAPALAPGAQARLRAGGGCLSLDRPGAALYLARRDSTEAAGRLAAGGPLWRGGAAGDWPGAGRRTTWWTPSRCSSARRATPSRRARERENLLRERARERASRRTGEGVERRVR